MRKDFTVKQFNEKIYFFGFYAIRSFFAVLGISAILVAFLSDYSHRQACGVLTLKFCL